MGLLKDLKLADKPVVTVLNKVDIFSDEFDFELDDSFQKFSEDLKNMVFCSAKTGLGRGSLLKSIEQELGNVGF